MSEPYVLREHQLNALNKLSNGKILCGKPGSGKSLVAATYYKEQEAPKLVYVITTAKKRDSFDWREEFYRIGIGPAAGPETNSSRSRMGRESSSISNSQEPNFLRAASGSSGDRRRSEQDRGLDDRNQAYSESTERERRRRSGKSGSSNLGDVSSGENHKDESTKPNFVGGTYPWVLTVDSWNNIGKYEDVKGAFFIFDEQRLVGSGMWTKKFLKIAKHNNWILLSGTPGDTWMDYIPVFVANNFYKNRTEFKREHVVYSNFTKFPKVDRYINVGRLYRQRQQLLVEMPFERHTKRHVVEVPLEYDKEMLDRVLKDRWNVYEDRPLRDVGEMFWIMRRVVNSDPSRVEMVKELWKNHPKLIVFYNFNFELEALRGLRSIITSELTSGEVWLEDSILFDEKYGTKNTGTLYLPKNAISSGGDVTRSAGTLTKMNQQSVMSTNSVDGLNKCTDSLVSKTKSTLSTILLPDRLISKASGIDKKLSGSSLEMPGVGVRPESETTISIAEWNGHRHDPIPETSRWLYLVQYTAGAEGWNCTDTDAMIMYSRNYSWKVTEQAYGRIDRLNTLFRDLWYYDFTTDSFIDRAIGRSLKAKETFNEAKFARMFRG